NDQQLREEKNNWRKEASSPLETPASAEKRAATIEPDARLSPTRIREINIDSQVDAKTQGRLRSLQDSLLTPEKLRHELKFLTDNLPKNTHGFYFSAERTRGK